MYPLQELTCKSKDVRRDWNDTHTAAFDAVKQALTTAPVLGYPDQSRPFSLAVDASAFAGGAVLQQTDTNGAERPVAYWSMTFNREQRNYTVTEKECLALVEAVRHFRPYLYGRPFELLTDHAALTWLFRIKDPASRLARWALTLQEYDIVLKYKPGKAHCNADAMSRKDGDTACEWNPSRTLSSSDLPGDLSLLYIQDLQGEAYDAPMSTSIMTVDASSNKLTDVDVDYDDPVRVHQNIMTLQLKDPLFSVVGMALDWAARSEPPQDVVTLKDFMSSYSEFKGELTVEQEAAVKALGIYIPANNYTYFRRRDGMLGRLVDPSDVSSFRILLPPSLQPL